MSAESPRRSRAGGPLVVTPQPPSDRSLMEAVSGFINDVTLTTTPGVDPRDVIQWARFETIDTEDYEDGEILPLLLILGYGSGIQVWVIQPGGEAQEVLSWRMGSVRVLRVLSTPLEGDHYAAKRPLIALCDSSSPGTPYCALSFISLSGGDQVKSIKFKNPILDVLANKRSIVVSFTERLAVFDACTLEDRLTVTTCYPSPCPLGGPVPANPIALGDRWLAYAERRLIPSKRSNGGCEGEGAASYTATVLHAAKSLGKGLRGLGESVASSLSGVKVAGISQSPSPPNSEMQPGLVTIIDLQNWRLDECIENGDDDMNGSIDNVIVHFVAHSEAIVALKFDASGMILITADKRGHDFHVFRIHPHPSGSTMASVHHLYILHRGDTTAKVQDISISLDTRWTAISTLRGTTHVFPITPYGGAVGVRTHASPHVVNRLSRFHRSAGLAPDGRSSSPVGENFTNTTWYPNPRLPPFPSPCTLHPLAQLRPAPTCGTSSSIPTHTITRNSSGRQRLSSLSEEGQLPLAVCSMWGSALRSAASSVPTRACGITSPPATQALYIMSAHGHLIQYYINPKHMTGIPKEKVCDDTSIEVEVEAKAQWTLSRPNNSHDVTAPLPSDNVLIKPLTIKVSNDKHALDEEDRWLSQVEIMTHAGPHRRLWMGPQFIFKTYNAASGTSLSLLDSESVEVGTGPTITRSNPVNMPGTRSVVPVLIESGSASSLEHSPRLSDAFRKFGSREGYSNSREFEDDVIHREGEVKLKEDLAEAMKETEHGCEWAVSKRSERELNRASHVNRIVNPLGGVVSGASSESPSPTFGDQEEESYILSNQDEALFRPVVRAPRSLPAPCVPPTKPLSTKTFLPVKRLSPPSTSHSCEIITSPADSIIAIPAKFNADQNNTSSYMFDNDNYKIIDKDHSSALFVETPKNEFTYSTTSSNTKKPNRKKKSTLNSSSKLWSSDNSEKCIDEVLKAVDKIEFCNTEVIGCSDFKTVHCENKTPSHAKESIVDNDDDILLETFKNVDETSVDTFERIDVSSSKENDENILTGNKDELETIVVNLKAAPKKSKRLLKSLENSPDGLQKREKADTLDITWELLKDEKHVDTEQLLQDGFVFTNHISESSEKSTYNDDGKGKNKKGKKNKTKNSLPLFDKNSVSEILNVKDMEKDKNAIDSLSSNSLWKSAPLLKETIDISKTVNNNTDDLNTSFSSKLSACTKKTDIVVAVCDKPLNFVNHTNHHIFCEPPPLKPLDLILDDVGNEEPKPSFINFLYSSSVSSDSKIKDEEDLSETEVEYVEKINEDESPQVEYVEKINKNGSPQVEYVEKINEDGSQNNFSKTEKTGNDIECVATVMEKSSDEENTSPSSSQTESDDYSNMTGSKVKLIESEESPISSDAPLIAVNQVSSKSNKKKPKRKRR